MSNIGNWVREENLPKWWRNSTTPWSARTDWLRIYLLYTYGGLWIDADIIVLQSLRSLNETNHDAVLFGATGHKCTKANIQQWLYPSNWMLASKKNGHLLSICVDLFKKYHQMYDISKVGYHQIGKHLLWQAITQCSRPYSYFHVEPRHCGIRDKNGYWITTDRLCSSSDIHFQSDRKQMIVIVWYLSEMSMDYKTKSEKFWLNSHTHMGSFIRQALQ